MSTRFAFLMGAVTGFFAGLVLMVVGVVLLVVLLTPEMTLDSLVTYRATVEMAQKPDEEKTPLLTNIDAIVEHIRAKRVGFLNATELTSDLDPLVLDCRLTDEEWEQMVAGVAKARAAIGSD